MRLPDSTHIAYAHLQVRDLDTSLAFYSGALGLHVIERRPTSARLSATGQPPHLIQLTAVPAAVAKPPRTTGLYHVAIRLPTRAALARLFYRLVRLNTPFQGFADHLVSEALYLRDPDGNGVELYRDRPREQWPRQGDQIEMATDPLDHPALLAEGEHSAHEWQGIDPAADIGHIHLQVSDLGRAKAFYVDALGMTVTQRSYPGALFVAAGGYHHHLGLNTWAGRGAAPPPDNAVGLRSFGIAIDERAAWEAAAARLNAELDSGGQIAHARDADGARVELVLTPNPAPPHPPAR